MIRGKSIIEKTKVARDGSLIVVRQQKHLGARVMRRDYQTPDIELVVLPQARWPPPFYPLNRG